MAAADAIQAAKERLASLLAPIDGGVGVDITYETAFESVKNETDKLQAISGGKPDWAAMLASCEELLSEKSKDFRVAVYYAAAKAEIDKLPGLLDGLVLVAELDAAFWEAMYPPLKRPRQRGNLTSWLGELITPIVEAHKPVAKDADLVAAIDEVSKALDADLRDKLGEAYTGLGGVRGAVRNLLSIVPKEAPPPPPPPPPPEPGAEPAAEAAPVAAAPGISAASITDADSAASAITEVALVLARAGDALRASDPTSAAGYRILRQGIWLELTQAPPADGGATLVPPPPSEAKEYLESMATGGNWLGLLAAAEENVATYPLWLDPHRYTATALDRMGGPYADARAAVVREVAGLLARAPTLPTLTFNDGTPLADASTRAWLETDVAAALGSGGGGGGSSVTPVDLALDAARAALANGQLDQGLSSLRKVVEQAPTPADRFKGRLAMARLCIQAEQWPIARAQLEALEKQATRHDLAEWDPALAAELYSTLFTVLRTLNAAEGSPESLARQAQIFERFCQLDPGAAVRLLAGA